MIIIGEKINGAIPSVGKAIAERNDTFIRDLVKRQVAAGADYLDACAGTAAEEELNALTWLIDIIQEETDTPLCVDSPNAKIIEQVLPKVKKSGLINSVSSEGDKCEVIYPLIKGTDWNVVALTCDNDGIPDTVEKKVAIAETLIEKAATFDITDDRIFIDPLVLSLSAVNDCMLSFISSVKKLKERHPAIHTVSGLSNISYGMPYRKIVNMNFLTLSMYAGMDAAIIDPENRDMIATIYAVDALLAKDKHCRNYNKAFRQGKFGPVK